MIIEKKAKPKASQIPWLKFPHPSSQVSHDCVPSKAEQFKKTIRSDHIRL